MTPATIAAAFPPGIHPFWFWNTAMDEARIAAQLAALAAGGCRGALIHARQGYPGGYLSARWRELVAYAVARGAELGLAIGACDEFPYPSGNAGGLVVLGHPERWATDLAQVAAEADGGMFTWDLPAGALLDCAAFPLVDGMVRWDGRRDLAADVGVAFRQETYREAERDLSAYNGRRYFACDPAPRLETVLPPGRWLVLAAVQTVWLAYKYVGPSADTLDPEAMAACVALTRERHAGIPLRALFVDEIAAARWSRHLPGWFLEATGEPLAPLLPALARADHPRAAEVRATVATIRRERFAAAFLTPLRAWCREAGVVLCEERHLDGLADAGADIPGCDPGHTRIGARHDLLGSEMRRNARGAAAAGALAHGFALCECGHSLGWGGTLEDLRAIADGLLLNGITHLVPHAAFASTAALRKHDAPPSFFIQQAWWPLHRLLAARVATILEAFAGSVPEVEVVVPPGTPEDVQHRLMAAGHGWTMADGAPAPDPAAMPAPRRAPWSDEPLVERMVRRHEDGRHVALLLNRALVPALVRLPAGWQPLALDGAAPEARDGGWLLEPAQALLAMEGAQAAITSLPHHDIPWPTTWTVRAPGGNLLRLGRWRLAIDGREAEVTHFPLSEQLRRSALPLAPAIDPGFGSPLRVSLPPLACTYRAEFHCAAPVPVRLLMEPETLVAAGWTIRINDGPALGPADFTPCAGLPDEALGCDVTPWLRPGANAVTVTVTAKRADGGLRNPLYLHGAFAVLPGARIAPARTSASFADRVAAGLPFACGSVEWSAEVDLPQSAEPCAVRLPQLAVDAFEVAVGDGPWQAVAWAPRRLLLAAGAGGRRTLRVRQHLTPAGCFHGEGWDVAGHRTIAVGEAVAAVGEAQVRHGEA